MIDYLEQVLAIAGAISVMLTALGALLPEDSTVGRWCRVAATDLRQVLAWLRGVPPMPLVCLGAIAASVACHGCAGSLESARVAPMAMRVTPAEQVQRCQDLDREHMVWDGIGKVAALVAGGSGLSTIPVNDDSARIGLVAGAVAASALSVYATTISTGAAEAWARECSR